METKLVSEEEIRKRLDGGSVMGTVNTAVPNHGILEIELLRYYRQYVEIKIANGEMPLTFERWLI